MAPCQCILGTHLEEVSGCINHITNTAKYQIHPWSRSGWGENGILGDRLRHDCKHDTEPPLCHASRRSKEESSDCCWAPPMVASITQVQRQASGDNTTLGHKRGKSRATSEWARTLVSHTMLATTWQTESCTERGGQRLVMKGMLKDYRRRGIVKGAPMGVWSGNS